jgi:hypothetical protein
MTENKVEDQVVNSDILPVATVYVKWKELNPHATVFQALHPVVLNRYDENVWKNNEVARQVAEWILLASPQEAVDWYLDREHMDGIIEGGKYYNRVHEVMNEMGKFLNPDTEK